MTKIRFSDTGPRNGAAAGKDLVAAASCRISFSYAKHVPITLDEWMD